MVLVIVASAMLVRDGIDGTRSWPWSSRSVGPPADPSRWTRIYTEDFRSTVRLGGFTNDPSGTWNLAPSNPYSSSLVSYPDGWGTTEDRSVNMASRTTDVVPTLLGAKGVLRLQAGGGDVAGRRQGMAASFFSIVHPDASSESERLGQVYGRYSVRFRTQGGYPPTAEGGYPRGTTVPRYGTAFLLWPVDDDRSKGEIDYPEMPWGDTIHGFVHEMSDTPDVNSAQFERPETTADGWHVATTNWSPGLLQFYLDGDLVSTVSTDVPNTPMRWGFQSGGMYGPVSPELTGTLLVDWVTIDAWNPTP